MEGRWGILHKPRRDALSIFTHITPLKVGGMTDSSNALVESAVLLRLATVMMQKMKPQL